MTDSSARRAFLLARRVSTLALSLALGAAFPACGGGGGGGGGSAANLPLAISTPLLPTGGLGVPYDLDLYASGGEPPYAWTLEAGSSLPPGLSLSTAGTISGSPTSVGSWAFSVSVADASTPAATDTASYLLEVREFDAWVALLHWGEAWAGDSYPLASVGGKDVTFTLVTNASGGSIANADLATGSATWVAGPNLGTDRIRATSSLGPTEDLVVDVKSNPAKNMVARFSTTDVWYLKADGKFDATHAFACDFDAALASAGLRAPTSTDATGTTADQVAKAYVRLETLKALNAMYLNATDGTPATGGLAISFPFEEPLAPHSCPAPGQIALAKNNQFNVVSLISATASNVIGSAYVDDADNDFQENDTTSDDGGELGVFVDEIVRFFNPSYGSTALPQSPVGAADVPALKALLYGTASPGGRYAELKRIGEGLGRTIAAVAAHEIGHSLGLTHTTPAVTSSIMNAVAAFGQDETYSFVAADVTALRGALPGPHRGGTPMVVLFATAPLTADGDIGFETAPCRLTCTCRHHRR
jgi:hypothetical protein